LNIERPTSNVEWEKMKEDLRSGATSLFDVRRSMFDVGRSSFKTTSYGINATCEPLQNKLALARMGG